MDHPGRQQSRRHNFHVPGPRSRERGDARHRIRGFLFLRLKLHFLLRGLRTGLRGLDQKRSPAERENLSSSELLRVDAALTPIAAGGLTFHADADTDAPRGVYYPFLTLLKQNPR